MAKFNTSGQHTVGRSPIETSATPAGTTYEGAPGYARTAKSELFLLAVTNLVGESTFYENAANRDNRYTNLIRTVAVEDTTWTAGFLGWMRSEANMRTAAVVGAAEAANAMIAAKMPGARKVVSGSLWRADEPGELLAYWLTSFGKTIPIAVKRGIADAVARLYTERALLKWDSRDRAIRFGDVIELVQPAYHRRELRGTIENGLFRYAIERRHQRDNPLPDGIPVIAANARLRAAADSDPSVLLDADALRQAGMTWEDVLSLAGTRVDKAKLWEALIPSMGFMALLRNLRNFDQAGVSDQVAGQIIGRLADPAEVARSGQLPMRFLSAYRAAPSLRWSYPLEQALGHCLTNIPQMPGRTLILVDTSSSMNETFSKDGVLRSWDAATVFGIALAHRCATVDLVSYSSSARFWGEPNGPHTKPFPMQAGESVLRAVQRWKDGGWFLGGGTATAAAIRKHYAGHDRVVLLTDEQTGSDPVEVSASMPRDRMLVTFNLAGYQHGHAPSGGPNRVTIGGLTDQAFRMLPLLEAGRNATWPWLQD